MFSTTATAPASGSKWEMSVASATGGCEAYQITKASVPLAKC
jgi:hypothetical protein